MSKLFELFGRSLDSRANWHQILKQQECPYTGRECIKGRKSEPSIKLGTCSGCFGKARQPLIICPQRFLADRRVFTDCLPLLKHRSGNELHIVPEVSVPGGNIDYFLVSARQGDAEHFVGIEFQTLDTTGSLWPDRQAFLRELGVKVAGRPARGTSAGVNWKMTAKTILMQLHHKIETFEALDRKLVLVVQDPLLDYMRANFSFGHLSSPGSESDSLFIHPYAMDAASRLLLLGQTMSTNRAGLATALHLGVSAKMAPHELIARIQAKMSASTLWQPV